MDPLQDYSFSDNYSDIDSDEDLDYFYILSDK